MYSKSNKECKYNQISCTFAVSNTLNEKDMKKLAICITLIAAILTGCNGDEKAAQARLDKARAMYENNEFFGAKNEIDSIRALYPKEVKVLKQGLTLMRQVEVKEAERNIAFCDSLLPIKLEEVEGLKKGFAFEKDSVYEEIGNYIWKQQTIERNVQRCYVRCGVNEEGEMYLASVYYGGRPIEHTGIKLSLKEYQIMEIFMSNPKQIVSKEFFIEKIWGYESDVEYNNIEVYISFLRKKLQSIHANISIKTARGIGYFLEEQPA